jgi:hypothetical protein
MKKLLKICDAVQGIELGKNVQITGVEDVTEQEALLFTFDPPLVYTKG